MRYKTPLLALLVVIAALSAYACSSGDDDGSSPTLFAQFDGNIFTVKRTGNAISGAFLVSGAFDVVVTSDSVTSDNSRLYVYEIVQEGGGFRTKKVAGSGPKAVAEHTVQRPGPILDLTFDLGPGEYYVHVDTAPENGWTMTVTGVSSVR
jgi:hypothetical protein